eukprot:TRINITY_DN11434_c0_g1_i4.p1 TRINITY_DN11434_c0_g1~~TRINITY_DN11434_c0_g1_i4.p1  ORF type:complete len:504 (+),score=38.41 TRINITY_DN11434_c0_g1_i4:179-1513(+)
MCGNPDVSPDGKTIVWGAITKATNSWDIYMGDLNVTGGVIANVRQIVASDNREEDPRFNYDGTAIVYKSGKSWVTPIVYNINMYNVNTKFEVTAAKCVCSGGCQSCDHCELWGPVFHPCGKQIAYAKRSCSNTEDSDDVFIQDLDTAVETRVTNNTIPDMFQHYQRDGTLIFSRKEAGRDNLYVYNGSTSLFLDHTVSDDDPYAFKDTTDYLMFIGNPSPGYDIYVRRAPQNDVVQLTNSSDVLGPVVFSLDGVTPPAYCSSTQATTAPLTTAVPSTATPATLAPGTDSPGSGSNNTSTPVTGTPSAQPTSNPTAAGTEAPGNKVVDTQVPTSPIPWTFSPRSDRNDNDNQRRTSREYSILLFILGVTVLCGTTVYLMFRRYRKQRRLEEHMAMPVALPMMCPPNMGHPYTGPVTYNEQGNVNPLGYYPPPDVRPPPYGQVIRY